MPSATILKLAWNSLGSQQLAVSSEKVPNEHLSFVWLIQEDLHKFSSSFFPGMFTCDCVILMCENSVFSIDIISHSHVAVDVEI